MYWWYWQLHRKHDIYEMLIVITILQFLCKRTLHIYSLREEIKDSLIFLKNNYQVHILLYEGVYEYMRVSWKVHRLTKKELRHSNETWHALNSTFSDTNCIVPFQMNPHWISNSGLWKVAHVLETVQNGLENWRRESCFTRTMLLHTSLHVVAMVAVCDCGFELVDHPPYSPDLAPSIFGFPTWKNKNTWLGSSIR